MGLSAFLHQHLPRVWQRRGPLAWALRPVAAIYGALTTLRRMAYATGIFKTRRVPALVIVVGNVVAGGAGKTPVTMALARHLLAKGLQVGVISRGHGRKTQDARAVTHDSHPLDVGDEPLLIRCRTGVPVVIDPRRSRALRYAIEQYQPDIIISDDGLQHFALPRTVEIVVLDADRGLGNGRCLPAGPLREPPSRLDHVDYLVLNGRPDVRWPQASVMVLQVDDPVNLKTGEVMPMEDFAARHPLVHAFAGIGNPQRFFSALSAWDIRVTGHPMPDHHLFTAADFAGLDRHTIVMTEKDAVKCAAMAADNIWYLPVTARLPNVFLDDLYNRLLRGTR